jgi:methanogenic corrinoid protein MtbC1
MPKAPVETHPAGETVPPLAADPAAPARSPLTLCRELLGAISRLEAREVDATLDRSLVALGLHRTVEEVLLPSMREVGARWSRGVCDTDEENLATAAVRSWLEQRAQEAPPPLDEAPVVLTCGPLDHHTIALETFQVLLTHARFDCVNLGAETPPTTLATAVDRCSAQAVVLVSHLARHRAAAVSALRAVEHSSAMLFYAGAAFRTAATRQGIPGRYLGGNLHDAAADVTTRLRTAG